MTGIIRMSQKRKNTHIKQAVILAGGEGRRLRPFTRILPKPLLPVGNIPIIEVLLRQLAEAEVSDIIIAVGYHAELIKLMVGDGSQWGIKIKYALEESPLGTAGPLRKIKNLDEDFLVLNGDLLTDLPFRRFIKAHVGGEAPATIAVQKRSVKVDFGVIDASNGIIDKYHEKPVLRYDVSMGVYAFRRSIVKLIPDKKFDFPDLVQKLIEIGRNPAIFRYRGRWYDIGRPDDWEKADRIFARNPEFFLK